MNRKRKYILKTISCLLICIFFISQIFIPKSESVTQFVSSNIDSLDNELYPGIRKSLQNLKDEHPNWNFKILYTGLDWNDVLENEYTGHGATPTNLIPANSSTYNNNWICNICGNKTYDTGEWLCASKEAIAYMMDIRNWLDADNIFQFLELTYSTVNYEQIKYMVSGTFLDNTSYINAIADAAKIYNVNPYYIVARAIQEQGKAGTLLVKGQGYNGQYAGYYNVFNIGATGNNYSEIMINALKRAQKEGWTSIESAIRGGIKIIASNYIAQGQNTIYLQKFDVENSDGTLYTHQYMQNLLASKNEASKMRDSIKSLGATEQSYTFLIPVFENMPAFTQINPNLEYELSHDLVKVNVEGTLRVRNAPNGTQILDILNGGEIVTRVEKAKSKFNGTYWDRIQTNSGMYGYVARETYEGTSEYKQYLLSVESLPPTEEIPPDAEGNITIGDVNNDGKISPTDYVLIKNHIMQTKLLETEAQKIAADVNRDGKISPIDYVKIKNYIMYGTEL